MLTNSNKALIENELVTIINLLNENYGKEAKNEIDKQIKLFCKDNGLNINEVMSELDNIYGVER